MRDLRHAKATQRPLNPLEAQRLVKSTTLQDLDLAVREGRVAEARESLLDALHSAIPREKLRAYAQLCRRVGWPEKGLRLLHQLVRPSAHRLSAPAPQELAEYAACLVRIGAITEVKRILKQVKPEVCPEARLFSAFAAIHEWDYASALPLLRAFIADKKSDPYLIRVAQVNRAAAEIYLEDHDAAEATLAFLRRETALEKNWLLHANCLELSAQNELGRNRFEQARAFLMDAREHLVSAGVPRQIPEFFYVEKWLLFVDIRELGPTSERLALLQRFREEAQDRGYWEVVRDCDAHKAFATRDNRLLRKLIFSSPAQAFRARLLAEAARHEMTVTSTSGRFTLGTNGRFAERPTDTTRGLLSVSSGRWECGEHTSEIKIGQVPHRTLGALCRDFYKPQRLGELFESIFPNRYFDPDSSPALVHQACFHLRNWFARVEIPAVIEESGGGYRLIAKRDFDIELHLFDPGLTEPAALRDRELRRRVEDAFGVRKFKSTEAGEVLGLSKRASQLFLTHAVHAGWIHKEGAGPRTVYSLSHPSGLGSPEIERGRVR